MNFFTAIKNFFVAAPKLTTDIFDKDNGLLAKAGSFINDLHYSDVEKAEAFADMCKAVSEHVKSTLSESTERSVTRRSIAVLWIKVQLALILMTAICIPFKAKLAMDFFNLSTCNIMLWGTGSVIVFFFGAYAWGSHVKKKQ